MNKNKNNFFNRGNFFLVVGVALLFLIPLVSAGLTWTRATGQTFNQDLNTYDDVTFNDLTLTGNYTYVSTYTYEAGLTLNGFDAYWKLGQNQLSAGEGVKMWSDGSIAEFGWTCSRTPPLGLCSSNFEIRIAGSPIVAKSFTANNVVHKFGRGELTFTAGEELSIYYDLIGSICGATAKAGCGGWIAVYNDDLN